MSGIESFLCPPWVLTMYQIGPVAYTEIRALLDRRNFGVCCFLEKSPEFESQLPPSSVISLSFLSLGMGSGFSGTGLSHSLRLPSGGKTDRLALSL